MVEDTDGRDLLFITGAPGSRWSGVAHALSYADQINNSDVTPDRVYVSDNGVLHFGNYLGPGMEFGENLDRLPELSKAELLNQLRLPYREPGGVRLLKGHLFSRHLDRLLELFPRAGVVLVYRNDADCLDWWLKTGGFSITFPDYTWYRDMQTMQAEIAADNRAIRRFAETRGLQLRRHRGFATIFKHFRLSYSEAGIRKRAASDVPRPFGLETSDVRAWLTWLHAQARVAKLAHLP